MKKFLLSLLLTAPTWANPYDGTVYGVYPEGVLLDRGGQSVLIPTQYASFELGGLRVQYGQLQPGQVVHVNAPPNYVQMVGDPYQWQCKHHPQHPHGGPPGQMKKHGHGHGHGHGRGHGDD